MTLSFRNNNRLKQLRPSAADPIQTALAILATVIGAGFASGREVITFFTRFGAWSWLGVAVSGAAFGGLVYGLMRLCSRTREATYNALCLRVLGKTVGRICSILYAVLMIFTAGAMASGVGEIARLSMTIPYAYGIGMAAALIAGTIWARRGVKALATGGSFLLPVCVLLYIVIAWHTRSQSGLTPTHPPISWLPALPLALAYACLNITLCCGLISEVSCKSDVKHQRRVAIWFTVMITGLLAAANAVLLPNAAMLENAALPMLLLARGSLPASLLASAALLLAMMTTLTALLRSIAQFIAPDSPCGSGKIPPIAGYIAAPLLAALSGAVGFNRLIGLAYPIMGWACAAALLGLLWAGFKRNLC